MRSKQTAFCLLHFNLEGSFTSMDVRMEGGNPLPISNNVDGDRFTARIRLPVYGSAPCVFEKLGKPSLKGVNVA